MKEKRGNLEKCIDWIIILVVGGGMRFFLSFRAVPLLYLSDETSAISVAAKIAGYDWSSVVSNAGYYGIGYLWIFFPLFKMGIPAETIYQIALFTSAILVALTGVICYSILKKFYADFGRLIIVLISIVCSQVSILNTMSMSMWNEEILLVCAWLMAYFCLELLNCPKKEKYKLEIKITVVFTFALTVHARSVVFIGILFLLACLYYYKNRTILFGWRFWVVQIIEYYSVKKLLKFYQSSIWNGTTRNTSVSEAIAKVSNKITFDIYTLKSSIMTLVGIIHTSISLTFGISLVITVVLLLGIFYFFMKDDNKGHEDLLCVGIAYFGGYVAILLAQTYIWIAGMHDSVASGGYQWVDSYRAFTYTRYAGFLFPICVFIGMVLIFKVDGLKRKAIPISIIGMISFTVIYIFIILPYMKNRAAYAYLPITQCVSNPEFVVNEDIWYVIFHLCLMYILISCFMIRKSKHFMCVLLCISILYMNYERYIIFKNNISLVEESKYEMADGGYKVLNELEEELSPDNTIYVFENSNKTDHQIFYIYQFLNYKYKVIPRLPDTYDEEMLLFTNKKIDSIFLQNCMVSKLDDNEYVYCRGQKYIELLEKVGVDWNE